MPNQTFDDIASSTVAAWTIAEFLHETDGLAALMVTSVRWRHACQSSGVWLDRLRAEAPLSFSMYERLIRSSESKTLEHPDGRQAEPSERDTSPRHCLVSASSMSPAQNALTPYHIYASARACRFVPICSAPRPPVADEAASMYARVSTFVSGAFRHREANDEQQPMTPSVHSLTVQSMVPRATRTSVGYSFDSQTTANVSTTDNRLSQVISMGTKNRFGLRQSYSFAEGHITKVPSQIARLVNPVRSGVLLSAAAELNNCRFLHFLSDNHIDSLSDDAACWPPATPRISTTITKFTVSGSSFGTRYEILSASTTRVNMRLAADALAGASLLFFVIDGSSQETVDHGVKEFERTAVGHDAVPACAVVIVTGQEGALPARSSPASRLPEAVAAALMAKQPSTDDVTNPPDSGVAGATREHGLLAPWAGRWAVVGCAAGDVASCRVAFEVGHRLLQAA